MNIFLLSIVVFICRYIFLSSIFDLLKTVQATRRWRRWLVHVVTVQYFYVVQGFCTWYIFQPAELRQLQLHFASPCDDVLFSTRRYLSMLKRHAVPFAAILGGGDFIPLMMMTYLLPLLLLYLYRLRRVDYRHKEVFIHADTYIRKRKVTMQVMFLLRPGVAILFVSCSAVMMFYYAMTCCGRRAGHADDAIMVTGFWYFHDGRMY